MDTNMFNAIATKYAPELADLTDTYRFQQIKNYYDDSEDRSNSIAAAVQSARRDNTTNNNNIIRRMLMGRQMAASYAQIADIEDTADEHDRREHASSNFKEIGPNKTRIDNADYQAINWHCAGTATRSLLNIMFDKDAISTHSTCASAPTSQVERELEDIVHFISTKYGCRENIVRSSISAMCHLPAQKMRRRKALINGRSHMESVY